LHFMLFKFFMFIGGDEEINMMNEWMNGWMNECGEWIIWWMNEWMWWTLIEAKKYGWMWWWGEGYPSWRFSNYHRYLPTYLPTSVHYLWPKVHGECDQWVFNLMTIVRS
jgi:hypothetical protein